MTRKKRPVAQRSLGEILADAEAGWEPSAKEQTEIQVIAKEVAKAGNAAMEQIVREYERVIRPIGQAWWDAKEQAKLLSEMLHDKEANLPSIQFILDNRSLNALTLFHLSELNKRRPTDEQHKDVRKAMEWTRDEYLKRRKANPGTLKKTIVFELIPDIEREFGITIKRTKSAIRNISERWLEGL